MWLRFRPTVDRFFNYSARSTAPKETTVQRTTAPHRTVRFLQKIRTAPHRMIFKKWKTHRTAPHRTIIKKKKLHRTAPCDFENRKKTQLVLRREKPCLFTYYEAGGGTACSRSNVTPGIYLYVLYIDKVYVPHPADTYRPVLGTWFIPLHRYLVRGIVMYQVLGMILLVRVLLVYLFVCFIPLKYRNSDKNTTTAATNKFSCKAPHLQLHICSVY